MHPPPLWGALLPHSSDTLPALAVWALQFTARVAQVEDAVLLEVSASVRLFGGKRALRNRVVTGAKGLGVSQVAWASNGLAALALARAGVENGFKHPLADLLDTLPIAVLTATAPHRTTLLQLGTQTLGELRRLPRGGVSRRFGADLLAALDQAYGLQPEAHEWVKLPEVFEQRLELLSRVEHAEALLFGARRLVLQLVEWLAARQAGVAAFALHWVHDSMRSRDVAGAGDALTVRTALPTRDVTHLMNLLAEHLAHVQLVAPVGELRLTALDVVPLVLTSASFLPEPSQTSEALSQVLERMAARLGPDRVRRPVLVEDHRLEHAQQWQSATQALPRRGPRHSSLPQPTFLLKPPLRLGLRAERPLYQGALRLLVGPQRVEGGWWHRVDEGEGAAPTLQVQRDYWVALSPRAGLLWVFQERLAADQAAWYLHGFFA